MDNTNNNNKNQAVPQENEVSEPKPQTTSPAFNTSTPETNQDPKVNPEEKPAFSNDLLEINKDELSAKDKDELPTGPIPPVPSKIEKNEVEESEAELPHQPDPIRPDDIIETEQEPPEEKITAEDIEKVKDIETSPLDLPEPKTTDKLEPLTPARKKKILPETMSSSEVVACLKDLRIRLNELLVKANEVRRTHSEKNLELIMEYAWRTQKVTNDDVERITGVKDTQARRYLKKLVIDKKLVRFGRYKYTFYKPIKD